LRRSGLSPSLSSLKRTTEGRRREACYLSISLAPYGPCSAPCYVVCLRWRMLACTKRRGTRGRRACRERHATHIRPRALQAFSNIVAAACEAWTPLRNGFMTPAARQERHCAYALCPASALSLHLGAQLYYIPSVSSGTHCVPSRSLKRTAVPAFFPYCSSVVADA